MRHLIIQSKMAFTAQLLAFSMLLMISQAYSTVEQSANEVADDAAIKALQTEIRYQFKDQTLLMLAMTHGSYSLSNNGALSVLGYNIIQTATSLHYLLNNSAIGKGDLHAKISEFSNCNALLKDAVDLRLHDLIRVAPKVDPNKQSILCECYRALFGAIGADANLDVAKEKFWKRIGWNGSKFLQNHLKQGGFHLKSQENIE